MKRPDPRVNDCSLPFSFVILACLVLPGLSACCVDGDPSPTGMPTGMCYEPVGWIYLTDLTLRQPATNFPWPSDRRALRGK